MGETTPQAKAEQLLTVSDFEPYSPQEISYLYGLFEREFNRFFNAFSTDGQIEFIEGVSVVASRIIARQIESHGLATPRASELGFSSISAKIPHNLKGIRLITDHQGLAEELDGSKGNIMDSPETLVSLMKEMASGEVTIKNWDDHNERNFIEDFAVGAMQYLSELASKNGGLVVDEFVTADFYELIGIYNFYKHPKS